KPGEPQTVFTSLSEPPNAAVTYAGLRLVLSAARRGSLDTGAPVTYRQVKVGEVVNYELGATADRVLIHVLIEPRYAKLVHTGSRFWTTSGIGVDAGLFSGVQVQTESLESIIAGGVSFATPDVSEMGSAAKPGQTFALFDAANEEWLQWAPKIRIGK
ncbi:MAG TPA: MCE family protein, partial [Pseudomonas sp.]|nr:MCE family protein [Pseudomonas sp.]